MNKVIYGSFYTKDTPYEQVVKDYFLTSCEKWKIHPIVIEMSNHKTWIQNVAEKPRAIREILNGMKEDEVLAFMDADATIEQYPKLFEEISLDYDIGFHTLDWNSWYGYDNNPSIKELLTGTMFFRNTNAIKSLCTVWYETAKISKQWEQKVLASIIGNHGVTIYDLPIEYCFVKSLPDGREPLIKTEPVILHHQKSREYKRGMR
jgi:hypothetical protein